MGLDYQLYQVLSFSGTISDQTLEFVLYNILSDLFYQITGSFRDDRHVIQKVV
jgi:hypothetical protein